MISRTTVFTGTKSPETSWLSEDMIHTWSNGFGEWHARVPVGEDSCENAWDAIAEQLLEREVSHAVIQSRMSVVIVDIFADVPGTVVYKEVWED